MKWVHRYTQHNAREREKKTTTRSALLHSENRTESAGSAHYKRKGYLYSNKKNLRVNYDNDVALGPYWRSTSRHVHTHTQAASVSLSWHLHSIAYKYSFVSSIVLIVDSLTGEIHLGLLISFPYCRQRWHIDQLRFFDLN